MKRMWRIFAVAVAAAFGCQWAPAAVAQYACAMSGTVSASCCCAPAASDGCSAISRACTCCDVSFTPAGPAANTPASPVPATPATALPLAIVAGPDATDFGQAEQACALDAPPRSSPPRFIMNRSFRC